MNEWNKVNAKPQREMVLTANIPTQMNAAPHFKHSSASVQCTHTLGLHGAVHSQEYMRGLDF